MANPTWYDILGVSRDASSAEIKTAWRDAAERFEPGSGSAAQFRLFNEAAEVLLDPERRKAYDEQLGAPRRAERAPAEEKSTQAPQPAAPVAEQEPSSTEKARRLPRVPVAALVVLALLTVVTAGFAIFLGTQYQQASAYEESLDQAPSAAERAAAAVLAYDYETIEADRDAAAKFLTPAYREDYLATMNKLVRGGAEQTKARVKAEVLASSAMLQGDEGDPDRVPVLLFVNQTTVSSANSGEPSLALNRVRFDMVNMDGTWRVDGITSY